MSKHLTAMLKRAENEKRVSDKLLKENPDIPNITRIVMAMDFSSAEQVDAEFKSGELDFNQAQVRLGSFARFEYVVRWLEEGRVSAVQQVFPILPELWAGSDPDDTDPRYLKLWNAAWVANGRKMILGERAWPVKNKHRVNVYRGEPVWSKKRGIAWTLDAKVAHGFARGMGARVPHEGDVYQATVRIKRILAYIGDRGEDEIILDPDKLGTFVHWPQVIARYRRVTGDGS